LIVYGVIKDSKGRLSMSHPEYEIVKGGADDDAEQIHTGRITPIYRLKGAMTQKALRVAAWHVCQALPGAFCEDLLPTPSAEGEFAGLTRSLALREVHFLRAWRNWSRRGAISRWRSSTATSSAWRGGSGA
jgi:ATP-dependent DNA helicase RecG